MEVKLISIATSFALVIFVTWVWKTVNYVWWRPKKLEKWLREQGLKGNTYRLWHGDLKEMKAITKQARYRQIEISDDIVPHVMPFHHHIINKYGKNCFTWKGPSPSVNIMDPELIRDILSKHNIFRKPFSNPLTRLLVSGLVSYEGHQWATHRKIVNPAFHLEKLKHMVPAMFLSCSEIMSKWEKLVPTNGSCEIDVLPYLENLTGDVISRTAFGSSYEQGRRIFQLQKEQVKHTFDLLQTNYIPGWRFLPTKTNKRMKEINSEVNARLREIINRRDKAMKMGQVKNEDLLGILMESNFKEIEELENNKNVGIPIEDIIEECKLFYLAGQETTTNLLVWTMVMLGKHQDWQVRARAEVFQIFGNNKPNFDGLNHMKIVTMILYEVLRLYPPATMLSRITYEKTKVGNITIPPGVELSMPIILVHHDTEIWGDDAKEFKPERFSEGIANASKSRASFFPFSWGPRICIGQNFAMAEAKMAISMILQHFSFVLSPSYKHAPFPVLTLQPCYGANMILHKI